MLSERERRLLARIDLVATTDDRRFADGLRQGRPRLPREFRRRRARLVAGCLLLAVLPVCGLMLAYGDPLGVLIAWPAVLGIVWGFGARHPDRRRYGTRSGRPSGRDRPIEPPPTG